MRTENKRDGTASQPRRYSNGRHARTRARRHRIGGLLLTLTVALMTGALTGPARAQAPTIIEDSAIGTGLNQVSYTGTWTRCTGCIAGPLDDGFRYSSTYGSVASFQFIGTRVTIFGVKGPWSGQAAISIDGSTPQLVDTFATVAVASSIFTSNTLTAGTHTVQITNLHQRNAASRGYDVAFDRAEAINEVAPPPPTPPVPTALTIEDTTIGTGTNQVSYSTGWTKCTGCITSPNNSFYYSATAGAVATIRFSGTQVNIYGAKGPIGGFSTIRLDGGQPVNVDTYAPTSSITLFYSSDKLAAGTHTLTLTNTGQRNTSSQGNNVGFDRAEVTTGANPPPAPPSYAGPRSGKGWLTGTYPDPVMNQQNLEAFCTWRGAPCDFTLLYTTRNSWANVSQPVDLLRTFANWPGRLIISIPPFPEHIGASNATCATGAYDEYWKTFGRVLNAYGRQNSYLRIAWEGNGDWYEWSATNPKDYVNCWRHVADAINSTAEPDPTLCWCLNAHYSQNPPSHNPMDMYPGDAWVDGVGLDAYDHWPPSRTKAEFDAQANAPGGLNYWFNFARAHNKLFGVGEWGVVSTSGNNGGGDNANYIQWMYDWFVAHAGKGLAYEYYFNNCDPNNVGSNLYRPLSATCLYLNRQAGARYKQLYSGQ
ncbi:hypothetical protein CcI6DRAFT_01227 [Frankia sp. CcI6]|nr:hypothetical protein CcI6DRAFT_01227 [Frankia sp. CcI6]KFB05055.1 Glycosyl hydrolase family 26 [Frankia sp. Allo2]OHV55407.1 endoglucanase [Frankia sp. CgIS1]